MSSSGYDPTILAEDGGGIQGFQRDGMGYFVNSRVRSAWAAVYVLFILYLFSHLLRPFYDRHSSNTHPTSGGGAGALPTTAPVAAPIATTDPVTGEMTQITAPGGMEAGAGMSGPGMPASAGYAPGLTSSETNARGPGAGRTQGGFKSRVRNFANAFRCAFLLLLGTILVTTAGYGFTRVMLILFWIAFGLLILWAVMQFIPGKIGLITDALITLAFAVLLLIVWGLSWSFSPSMTGT
ncbi:hypothetical protein DFS34DRAFT_311046 [Phlyctochytrium arcticum]|nr:hypothetical protein DFS34DRAFT_311046 [Phlyctochytrium arcticum]